MERSPFLLSSFVLCAIVLRINETHNDVPIHKFTRAVIRIGAHLSSWHVNGPTSTIFSTWTPFLYNARKMLKQAINRLRLDYSQPINRLQNTVIVRALL